MRWIRRALLLGLIGLLLVLVFRGPLYRAVVNYRIVGGRTSVADVDVETNPVRNLDGAIKEALDSTAARLHFSAGRVSNDPRQLRTGSPANCVGYSALFAALLSAELQRSGLDGRYRVEHVIGKLYIGGWDLHALFNRPFWKDHDIVRITDRGTGQHTYVDPTLYDAVGIDVVKGP